MSYAGADLDIVTSGDDGIDTFGPTHFVKELRRRDTRESQSGSPHIKVQLDD